MDGFNSADNKTCFLVVFGVLSCVLHLFDLLPSAEDMNKGVGCQIYGPGEGVTAKGEIGKDTLAKITSCEDYCEV